MACSKTNFLTYKDPRQRQPKDKHMKVNYLYVVMFHNIVTLYTIIC
jgi:hypothetical protein